MLVFNEWRVQARFISCIRGRVVRKSVNPDPRLKLHKNIIFFIYIKLLFAAYVLCSLEARRQTNIVIYKKTSPQSCKPQVKIVAYPVLAQSGFEQPGPGAPVLGFQLMKA